MNYAGAPVSLCLRQKLLSTIQVYLLSLSWSEHDQFGTGLCIKLSARLHQMNDSEASPKSHHFNSIPLEDRYFLKIVNTMLISCFKKKSIDPKLLNLSGKE